MSNDSEVRANSFLDPLCFGEICSICLFISLSVIVASKGASEWEHDG